MPTIRTLTEPPRLSDLAADRRIAVFLDFDGTLVPIADAPDNIEIKAGLADQLLRLAGQLDGALALVSGRSLDDLHGHLGEIALYRAGSHGAMKLRIDGSIVGKTPESIDKNIVKQISDFALKHDLRLERKTHGVALHYRSKPELAQLARQFVDDVIAENELILKAGKCVIELVRPGASKADAVRSFMAEKEFSGRLPIFIGDDVTDEDGFAAVNEYGGFGIAVGERPSALARYHLDNVEDVHRWLML